MTAVYAGVYMDGDTELMVIFDPSAGSDEQAVMTIDSESEAGELYASEFGNFGTVGYEATVNDDFFNACFTRNNAPEGAKQVLTEYLEA